MFWVTRIKMAVSSCALFLCTVSITFRTSYCNYYDDYEYGYYYTEASTGTIVGSIAGGFVGLIVLCVITYVLGNKFCKKKPPPGTKIHPTRVSTVTSSSAAYNAYPIYQQPRMQYWAK
uniref:Uncharacterized protein LOC111110093 isoform X4 n=1 Tax=Crassostrea virginica TaxID=6565 RepID=A0A8B8BFM0_CRAVI|nr:uncharacterized protein LOC111110093 isoform X4 [Crassostrea virginica]